MLALALLQTTQELRTPMSLFVVLIGGCALLVLALVIVMVCVIILNSKKKEQRSRRERAQTAGNKDPDSGGSGS